MNSVPLVKYRFRNEIILVPQYTIMADSAVMLGAMRASNCVLSGNTTMLSTFKVCDLGIDEALFAAYLRWLNGEVSLTFVNQLILWRQLRSLSARDAINAKIQQCFDAYVLNGESLGNISCAPLSSRSRARIYNLLKYIDECGDYSRALTDFAPALMYLVMRPKLTLIDMERDNFTHWRVLMRLYVVYYVVKYVDVASGRDYCNAVIGMDFAQYLRERGLPNMHLGGVVGFKDADLIAAYPLIDVIQRMQ